MKMVSSIFTTLTLLYTTILTTLIILPNVASGQGCTNTCPPLNDIGIPQDSICEGDTPLPSETSTNFKTCFGKLNKFQLNDFIGPGRVTVISNYYFGCNAGRRESGVYAHVAQRLYEEYGDRVTFIASNKGASCSTWTNVMANDAVSYFPGSKRPKQMPIVMDDTDSVIRDLLFTPPFGHPSYVVFDGDLNVRHKFIGPCCGYESFYSCTLPIAKALNETLTVMVKDILNEPIANTTVSPAPTPVDATPPPSPQQDDQCIVGEWSKWSGCSKTCGDVDSGFQFKWRMVKDTRIPEPDVELDPCPRFVRTRPCTPPKAVCDSVCTHEIGKSYTITVMEEGFDDPRDVAFHPTPGYHLGNYSEGRTFPIGNHGDGEAWVLNGYNHSISIVSAIRSSLQTTFSRRDRGYYHYMINATALSFNTVSDSGRYSDRDSYNYWAVCNDNLNTYLDRKEPNYFMGPTLYDSFPGKFNTVNRLGEPCQDYEECYFLHADMLHESPSCIGIAHDPEVTTAFGNVYWAFDTTGNRENGQLVRFDFQQPHGPRSMDHSIAAVRRYPDIKLHRGDSGMHAGIVVHPTRREVYIANPGEGTILAVGADTGSFARIAREEYPIYSNQLPSFDYSIWECAEQRIFASGLENPSGMALSSDGERLYVAEHTSGDILVFEVSSGAILHTIRQTEYSSIQGMSISPNSETLYFVDGASNTLNAVIRNEACDETETTRLGSDFADTIAAAEVAFESKVGPDIFSLYHNHTCAIDSVIPNVTYFLQVHNDTGYAADDDSVQGPAGMNPTAYLLANRTDCGYTDELNFDALLLGGFYCHQCLPNNNGAMCEDGGVCSNVQWEGYLCDNEFTLNTTTGEFLGSDGLPAENLELASDVTYRINVAGENIAFLSLSMAGEDSLSFEGNDCGCAKNGPLKFKPSDIDSTPDEFYIRIADSTEAIKMTAITSCVDDPDYKFKNKFTCEWAAKKSKNCKKSDSQGLVSNFCPKTCNKCADDADDTTCTDPIGPVSVVLNNGSTLKKKCKKLQKLGLCKKGPVAAVCPVACESCNDNNDGDCVDESGVISIYLDNGKRKKKTCRKFKKGGFCTDSQVSAACPVSCNTCNIGRRRIKIQKSNV